MKAGAFGMSTGLFYVPGAFTPIEEVIELAKVAGKYGGIHISHMRDEAFGVLDSVRETIRIGEEGGLPTQVTHHKIVGPANYGKSVETLKLLEAARLRGVDATSDQYPYTASSNAFVASMIPQWAQEGGREQMLVRLKNPRRARRSARRPCASSAKSAAAAIRRTSFSRTATSTRRWPERTWPTSRGCAAWSRRSRTAPRRRCGSSSREAARAYITR